MADKITKAEDIKVPELVINDVDSIASYNEMVAEGLVEDNQLYFIREKVNHNTLAGRSHLDSHPISAITGLDIAIAKMSTDISNATTRISTLESEQADLTTSVASKADKTYVDDALAEKADISTVEVELSNKANKTDVDSALAEKVNITTFNIELSKKADSDDVTAALAHKVDTTTFESALATKANSTDLAQKVDKTTFDTEIVKKANQSDLEALATTVDGKVDKTAYESAINGIQTQIDALNNYSSSLQLLIMGVA